MARIAKSLFRSFFMVLVATIGLACGLISGLSCSSAPKTPAPQTSPGEPAEKSLKAQPAAESNAQGPTATSTEGAAGAKGGNWSAQMQSLSATLSDLLPLVASNAKFNSPDNFERIETSTKNLRQLAHGLSNAQKPNSDPTIKLMSGLFAEDIERALDTLKSGNRNYARQILKDTTSYCIQCHTQTKNGPDFPRLNLNINLSELSKVEQAEFFTATRQFDRALEAYLAVLKDQELAKADPFAWEQSARSALAIIVRVKNDSKDALALIGKIETQAALPESMKKSLGKWKLSIQEWRQEVKSEAKQGTKLEKKAKTPKPEDEIKQAETMILKAKKLQEFPLDHSQDIVYFRAASILHNYLQSHSTNNPLGAKSLFLAGVVAEATRDMNFWTLHESYYEQCIRAEPHSKQAQTCFDHLRDSITLGYSGSGGVNIPPEINRRLEGFREAATPKKLDSQAN